MPRRSAARRRKSSRSLAARSDRYDLYEASVQCPEAEVRFADRQFRKAFDRKPNVLREDFCGTGWLACEWVAQGKGRRAVGVDLDPVPLQWGEERHRAPMGEAGGRVELIEGDVRTVGGRRADVLMALNFSYMVFHERDELLEYFKAARSHLNREGLLILDVFGGTEAQEELEETTEKDDFDYVWDQDAFDPLSHRIRCYIHFRFPDGSEMKRAFAYDWRLWTVPELKDVLRDAGFDDIEVHVENIGKDGWGNGVYRKVEKIEPCEGFVAYVIARKGG